MHFISVFRDVIWSLKMGIPVSWETQLYKYMKLKSQYWNTPRLVPIKVRNKAAVLITQSQTHRKSIEYWNGVELKQIIQTKACAQLFYFRFGCFVFCVREHSNFHCGCRWVQRAKLQTSKLTIVLSTNFVSSPLRWSSWVNPIKKKKILFG